MTARGRWLMPVSAALLLTHCSPPPDPVPDGTDFRGLGNEPGWEMEVRAQSRLWFRYDYGAGEITVPIAETRTDAEKRQTTYVGRSDSTDLVVVLTAEACADTMADDTYPTRVEIRLDGRTFQGCGRPLH